MTIQTMLACHCTSCRSSLFWRRQTSFEDMTELQEAADEEGWRLNVVVPKGSTWEFCEKCYNHYITEELERGKICLTKIQ